MFLLQMGCECHSWHCQNCTFPNSSCVVALLSCVVDYASSSDSDSEQMLVDQAWTGDTDSDAESVDSEQEDPLK